MPGKPYFANYTTDQLAEVPPEELGHGGFCFVVAELLAEKYESNEVYRLTDSAGEAFAHVFIRVNGKPMDIQGVGTIERMRSDYSDGRALKEERVDMQRVRDRFYPHYCIAQLSVVRNILSAFIEAHPSNFPPRNSVDV